MMMRARAPSFASEAFLPRSFSGPDWHTSGAARARFQSGWQDWCFAWVPRRRGAFQRAKVHRGVTSRARALLVPIVRFLFCHSF